MVRVRKKKVLVVVLCLCALGMVSISKWNKTSLYLEKWLELKSCNCQKCLNDTNKDIQELLAASPKPFLSKGDTISESDFYRWRRLKGDKHSFDFFKTSVEQLFTVFPAVPKLEEQSPYRCRKCAVVGNSGNLNGSRYGELIDDHNIVIRMNRGRTKGHETDVGSKTTHHAMYPESAPHLDNTTHLVFIPFSVRDILWLLSTFTPRENGQDNPAKRGNKDLVMIVNPAMIIYADQVWMKNKGYYPSTGFIVFVLSLQMCDEVSVFGYGADADGNWSHYFEILRNKDLRTGLHPGVHEYEMMQELHRNHVIRFYKGV
ncbi:CMP-N-acetylneuraminate-beta-galactosamide-alpha-2,3-sialyltransferase 1-like [Nerophis lumbriciformis]|uniref:CMP-N-acetylneuraminate-beta-galactosamide- alpha-2,3-sialyltransferase 1-like n=1 Tax=Nerophis lumbriciformis TaxID=546530 RepID=UPI002AE06787|nr:CMP-N-acetylneuraminate-beta-galactosamide-alpha-2,3-sialyltransferase 1-like [Nerophis lumbriciformis]